MHRKYGGAGLAVASVNTDDPKEQGKTHEVRDFLRNRGAAFTNLMLTEDYVIWRKKLGVSALPAVLVVDRDGKVAKRFDARSTKVDSKQVEKLVVELLKKK